MDSSAIAFPMFSSVTESSLPFWYAEVRSALSAILASVSRPGIPRKAALRLTNSCLTTILLTFHLLRGLSQNFMLATAGFKCFLSVSSNLLGCICLLRTRNTHALGGSEERPVVCRQWAKSRSTGENNRKHSAKHRTGV
jgi:hypothetical protein